MPEPGNDFREWWTDVKAPGDGRHYLVGTVEVRDTDSTQTPTLFSGQPILRAAQNPLNVLRAFTQLPPPLGIPRQIVVLQVVEPAQHGNPLTEGIQWQRYFYGEGVGVPPREYGSTHARAVSVWPAQSSADTRIAICGECYDRDLPFSQFPPGTWQTNSGGAGGSLAAGFVAVFNGDGVALWTHHFFTGFPTGTPSDAHCAITDVSIRVEYDANSQPVRDVVTYCGVSSYGNPFAGQPPGQDPLQPAAPFGAQTSTCGTAAGGATDNGGGWDGIVGRLSRAHDGTGATAREFHSIVGGADQDGLFGLVELDADHFVVVGSTGAVTPAVGGAHFPFTDGTCPPLVTGSYCVGVIAGFDASDLVANGLQLEFAQRIGRLDGFTAMRDVHATYMLQGIWRWYAVGSTRDANLLADLLPGPQQVIGPQSAFGGGVDGLLVGGQIGGAACSFDQGTFRGGAGDQVLTGVHGWSEFPDHVCVTGYDVVAMGVDTEIEVASYFADTSANVQTPVPFVALTDAVVGGAGLDLPTAQGAERCTTLLSGNIAATSLPYEEFGLGDPGGGGVAVGPSGRATVVGATASADFPTLDGRASQGANEDGVRVLLDLVPQGVARTDGTGVAAPFTPSYPVSGVPGGTTPDCALSAFGRQIDRPEPELARMYIDWIGPDPAPGGSQAEVLVVRPPDTTVSQGGLWGLQVDWPGYSGDLGPNPTVLPEGYVLWTNSNPVTIGAGVSNFQSLRLDLLQGGTLPPSPFTMSMQLVCLVFPDVTGGIAPNCSDPGVNNVPFSSWAASPGLWFTY